MSRKVRNVGLSIHGSLFAMLYFRILGGRRSLRSLLVISSVPRTRRIHHFLEHEYYYRDCPWLHRRYNTKDCLFSRDSLRETPLASLRFALNATKFVPRVPRFEVQARLYTPLIRQIC